MKNHINEKKLKTIKSKETNKMDIIDYKRLYTFLKHASLLTCFLVSGVCLPVLGQNGPKSTLKITVMDDSGQLIAFRMQVFDKGNQLMQLWERGNADLSLPSGKYTFLIRHGFDYDAVRLDTLNLPAGITEKTVTLRKRYDIKKLGWYCGESHMHGQHGSSDLPQTFRDAARLAEANGLNYIQIAQWWTPDFSWNTPETLQQMAAESTTSSVTVNWNLESPKSYMDVDDGGKTGNLHCYGHGCTLGLKERSNNQAFWFTGPNFRIIQEIHRQNAVVMLAHPVRFWFNNGNFVSNMASEIAFDYVVGQGYDGVDIFNDDRQLFFLHEHVWWNLLNMGYKVSGTASSDGSIIDGQAGRYRTYTKINDEFEWDKIAQGIRNGTCIASSGPMVLFQVDGKDPGSEFPADGKIHHGNLQVWSSPLPGETLVSVQVIRNGEIVHAWDLRSKKAREWSGELELSDNSFAWYAIRVTSTCKDPGLLTQSADAYEVALANPVYFIPEGFHRPSPATATVKLHIMDEDSQSLPAMVSIVDSGKEIAKQIVDTNGTTIFTIPATAYLVIKSPGFVEVKKDLYMDSPIYDFCRNFNDFYTPAGFNKLNEMLRNLSFDVKLKKK